MQIVGRLIQDLVLVTSEELELLPGEDQPIISAYFESARRRLELLPLDELYVALQQLHVRMST